jgi:hypothetical protein
MSEKTNKKAAEGVSVGKTVAVRMPQEIVDRLMAFKKMSGLQCSTVVRECVEQALPAQLLGLGYQELVQEQGRQGLFQG